MAAHREKVVDDIETPSEADFAALGRFISNCSFAEACLHSTFRFILDIEEDVARMLIGEPRIGELIEKVQKLATLKSYPPDELAALDNAIKWLQYANKIRAIIAHKPFAIKGGALAFHNRLTAKDPNKTWIFRCQIAQLDQCSTLVDAVAEQLIRFAIPGAPKNGILPGYTTSPTSLEKLGLPHLHESMQETKASPPKLPPPPAPSAA